MDNQAVHIAFRDEKHFHHLHGGGSIRLFSGLDPYGTFCSTPGMVTDSLARIAISQCSGNVRATEQVIAVFLNDTDTAELRVLKNFHLAHVVTSCKSRYRALE